jgi:hypothetical protein
MNFEFETAPFTNNSFGKVNPGLNVNVNASETNQPPQLSASPHSTSTLSIPFVSPPPSMNAHAQSNLDALGALGDASNDAGTASVSLHPPISSPVMQAPGFTSVTMTSNACQIKHANDESGFTTNSISKPTNGCIGSRNGYSNGLTPPNDIPYISVEGRRKRRRTTFEDAFQNCLSMSDPDPTSINNENGDGFGFIANDSSLLIDDDVMTPIRDGNGSESGSYLNVNTPSRDQNISKRLDFTFGVDDNVDCASNNSDAITEHRKGGRSKKSAQFFRTMSSTDVDSEEKDFPSTSTSDEDDMNDFYGNRSDLTLTTDRDTSLSSLPASENYSVLFAPRKGRKQYKPLDPVDERLEDLIRHSRIKALMRAKAKSTSSETLHGSNDEAEMSKLKVEHGTMHESLKRQQMREKETDKNASASPSAHDCLRRKNEKEQNNLFTGKSTDDSGISPGALRSMERATRGGRGRTLLNDTKSKSRSSSIPRDMKYCESMDMDVNMAM